MKERLDVLLVNRGLASSREKAKTIIMSGDVFVNGQREDKAGSTFDDKCEIEVRGNKLKYVSRGGLKLEKAVNEFGLSFSINRRLYRLHASNRSRKGLFYRCGSRTA